MFALTFDYNCCAILHFCAVDLHCVVAAVLQSQIGDGQFPNFIEDLHFVDAAVSWSQIVDGQSSSFWVDLTAT